MELPNQESDRTIAGFDDLEAMIAEPQDIAANRQEEKTAKNEQLKALDESNAVKLDKLEKKEKKEEGSLIKDIAGIGEVVGGTAGVVSGAPIFLAEDIYNFGVDTVNFIDTHFGDGKELIDNVDLAKYMPEETQGYAMLREGSKFAIGYGKIIKAARTAIKGTPIVAELAAGYMTDIITAQPEVDALITSFVKKVPGIGEDIYKFLDDPTDSALTHRLKFGLAGMFEATIAEGIFKAFRHYGQSKAAQRALDATDEVPGIPKDGPNNIIKDDVASIPTIDADTVTRTKQVSIRIKEGKGHTGNVHMVDKAGNPAFMNIEAINGPEDVKKSITNMIANNPERYSREVLSDVERKALAKAVGMEPKDLLGWARENGLKEGQILAAVDMGQQVLETNANNFFKYNNGEITLEQMVRSHATTETVTRQIQEMKSMAGGMLHEANIVVGKNSVMSPKVMADLMETHGSDVTEIAKVIKGMEPSSARKIGEAIRTKMIMPVADRLVSMRYAGMLSDPMTHVRNVAINTQNMITRPGETLFEASLNAITTGKKYKNAATFADARHEATGFFHGFLDALDITAKKIKGQEAVFKGVDPTRNKMPGRVRQRDVKPADTAFGKALQFLDYKVIQGEFVGDALQFEDNFAKHMNATMTHRRAAYKAERDYVSNHANSASKTIEQVTEEGVELRKQLLANPNDKMLAQMQKDAENYTFTNNVPEGVLKKMEDLTSGTPVGRLIAPFARVNLNSMKFNIDRIPGLNLVFKNNRNKLFGTDVVLRNQELSRMAFTTSTIGSIAYILHSNDMITGNGPREAGKFKMFEQAGLKERTITIGETQIPYGKGPMGNVMAMIADIVSIREATGDDTIADEAGTAYVAILMDAFNPEFLTENVGKLFQSLARGDVKGVEAIFRIGADTATSFAPYSGAVRRYNREMTVAGNIKREAYNPSEIISSMINRVTSVYMPSELPIKRNILGQPMFYKEGLGPDIESPYGVNKELDNSVIQELARLAGANEIINTKTKLRSLENLDSAFLNDEFLDVAMPSKVIKKQLTPIDTQTMELNLHEYSKLVEFSAGIHPKIPKGMSLEATLAKVFKHPKYMKAEFGVQSAVTSRVLSIYKSIGKALYLEEPVSIAQLKVGLAAAQGILK